MQLEEPPANGEQSSPLPANFFKIWEFGGELHNLLYTLVFTKWEALRSVKPER